MQDPNLSVKESKRNTASTVRIQKKDGTQGFELSGLYEGFNTLTVSAVDDSDNPERIIISSDKVPEVMKLLDREGLPQGDVFYIDLNALTRILVADNAGKAESALVNLIASFKPAEEVQVEVTTTLSDTPKACIPSTARATIEWPAAVGRLTVLVSTPWSEALAKDPTKPGTNPEHLDGSNYTQPIVKATTTSGGTAQTVAKQDEAEDLSFKASGINNTLIGTNKQAGWQSYVGASVGYAQAAADPTFVLNAQVGAYKSHQYQIWELWAQEASGNYTRVGALRNSVWQWTNAKYSRLDDALTWNDASGKVLYETIGGQSTEGVASISVQAINWGSTLADLGLADADGNATFFVRTAPAASDVQAYFSREILNGSLQKDMGSYEKISARGINQTTKTQVGIKFEQEFGASSADVAWSVAHGAETGFDNGNLLMKDSKRNSMRVYYALTPGLGFKNIQAQGDPLGGLRSTEITNASLWVYLANENGQMEEQPTAIVRAEVPGDYRFTATGGATDFELKTTEDHRFYRVVTYYDDDGSGNLTRLKTPAQYVPYTAMSSDGAIIAASPGDKKVGDTEYIFDGWKSWEEGTWVAPGSKVADYDAALSYWGTKLVAQYHEKPKPSIGLMYLEFDNNGAVSGYYGTYDNAEASGVLPMDNQIASWGYYAVVPAGATAAQYQINGDINADWSWNTLQQVASNVAIGGAAFDLYAVPDKLWEMGASTTKALRCEGKRTRVTYNVNFAAAVTLNQREAQNWGQDEDTPWQVRHVNQFINKLEGNQVRPYYLKDKFKQSHDIDFAGVTSMNVSAGAFNGEYDGAYFNVLNFDPSIVSTNNRDALGLFPEISGGEVRQVNLQVVSTAQPMNMNGGTVGLLAGSVKETEFEDCIVRGASEAGPVQIAVKASTWSDAYVGGITGQGEKVEIENCSVAGVSFVLVDAYPTQDPKSVYFGGFAGYLSKQSAIDVKELKDYLVVDDAHIALRGGASAYAGGILGRGSAGIIAGGEGNTHFDNMTLTVNDSTEDVTELIGLKQ